MTVLAAVVRHGVLVLVAVALTVDFPRAQPPPPTPQEVSVVGLFVSPGSGQHHVLLQGKRDRRRFAMAIGLAEANGIAVHLENRVPPRPLTHDLFLTLFGRLKVSVTRVVITDLRNNTYYATVHLTAGGAPMELDSRPSDAIALAIRAKVPVFAEERVFEKSERVPGSPGGPGERI
jgi:bifunctional DNase/RNase